MPRSTLENDARTKAEEFRDRWGLKDAPIADPVSLIEMACGVDVTVRGASEENEHGVTMLDPLRNVAIVAVAASANPMHWRSTLAHELGHLVFEDHRLEQRQRSLDEQGIETRAQSFARHLLLPESGVVRFMENLGNPRLDLRVLSAIVQHFLVSPAIAVWQLETLNYTDSISARQFSSVFTPSLANRFGWGDQYRGLQAESLQTRAPQRLLSKAIRGYAEGLLPLETVATIRGLPLALVKAELDDAGVVPEQTPLAPTGGDDLFDGTDDVVDLSWLDE